MCPPARCEHGALLKSVPLRNTRFAEAEIRAASTGREVAHRLAYPPRGHGVTAVPNPATLTKQRAPKDPRQDLTAGRVESGQKRNGTAYGICGPGHPLKRPDLDSSGGATGYVGRRRKDTYLESLKRSSFSLNVGTDTLNACLKTPRSSACNASLPHVPMPSRAACWRATVEWSRALFNYHWYLWNVAAAINNRSLDFPFRECLFFISSGYRVATPPGPRSVRQAPTRPRRSSCW